MQGPHESGFFLSVSGSCMAPRPVAEEVSCIREQCGGTMHACSHACVAQPTHRAVPAATLALHVWPPVQAALCGQCHVCLSCSTLSHAEVL